jgi:SAM-dependent methyltransferase
MNGKTFWTNRSEELNKIWTTSDKDVPEYRKMMIQYIIKEVEERDVKQILDCGCGTGLLFNYLPEELKEIYYGCDFTKDMVDYCRDKFPEWENRFILHDIREPINFIMPDLIITQNVIQHILEFQIAMWNMMVYSNKSCIFCERSEHLKPTRIVGYSPAYRWIFNVEDFINISNWMGKKLMYRGEMVELARPKATKGRENVLSIFRIRR